MVVATYSVADFLLPEGYAAPRAAAVLREASVVTEAGRLAWSRLGRPGARRTGRTPVTASRRDVDPVVLVPGFLAGDASLALMARALREHGHPHLPVAHPGQRRLHARRPPPSSRRGSSRSSRAAVAGCGSSGTAWAACSPAASPYAAPTSSSGIVTLGSPMLAPGCPPRAP